MAWGSSVLSVVSFLIILCSGALAIHLDSCCWMSQLHSDLQNRTLQQVTLPGTHDSGSYYLTKSLQPGYTDPVYEELIRIAERLGLPINDIITPWALAQNFSFYDQLNAGIRYLDLRAGWNNSQWCTFHFETGTTVDFLLQDIARFLEEQPGEIVIVEISHTSYGNPTAEAYQSLVDMVVNILGQYMRPRSPAFNFTIGEMIQNNTRAIVSLDQDSFVDDEPLLWYAETILNSYANSAILEDMILYNDQQVGIFNAGTFPGQLYKISWTLTPQVQTVDEMFLPGHPKSLHELALEADGDPLTAFAINMTQHGYRMGNILILDFFEASSVINITDSQSALSLLIASNTN